MVKLFSLIRESEIGQDWVAMSDLSSFIKEPLFQAAVESICGPHLFALNPNLAQAIGHRLRLNEYILYVFGQTRRPLAVSRAKICPGSRPEVPSTPKPQERRYEVSRPTRAGPSRLTGSDYL